ncbi:MAG: hypothetical protein IIZ44_06845 [Muribaculaceae bacterium]|nr:hypothetical protein [Muribaculaceae bacterium]
MKARIKKTGEIVNLASYATITLEQCDSWGDPIDVKPEEIELIQEPTEDEHWQDVRERAAIAAMQGILCAPIVEGIDSNPSKEHIAELAVAQADALIEELKKK